MPDQRNTDAPAWQWFRSKPGTVPELERAPHYVSDLSGAKVKAQCGDTFETAKIERCPPPSRWTDHSPAPLCVFCLAALIDKGLAPSTLSETGVIAVGLQYASEDADDLAHDFRKHQYDMTEIARVSHRLSATARMLGQYMRRHQTIEVVSDDGRRS